MCPYRIAIMDNCHNIDHKKISTLRLRESHFPRLGRQEAKLGGTTLARGQGPGQGVEAGGVHFHMLGRAVHTQIGFSVTARSRVNSP
jgi:hypothetical protein